MIQFQCIQELVDWRNAVDHNQRVCFVPTMGALHPGHLSLIRQARLQGDIVVVSIFVNPAQFGPSEDFDKYPRTLSEDLNAIARDGVDVVFIPTAKAIYPDGFDIATRIKVPKLSTGLCAKSRPHFFEGVCSVVTRLLLLIRPHVLFLGEKDYQQLVVINKMVSDLFMSVVVVGCPIFREEGGLAMSSRNRYLTPGEHQIATSIYPALCATKLRVLEGVVRTKPLIDFCRLELVRAGVKVDYLDIRSGLELQPLRTISPGCRLLFAGWVGKTRLLDNIELVPSLTA